MPEVIQFPEHRAAPSDWLLEDLLELKAEIEALLDNEEAMSIIIELIEGRKLMLELALERA
jgi:hypothetical protein